MRRNRHGWQHERQPEHIIRAAAAVCIAVIVVLAVFAVLAR